MPRQDNEYASKALGGTALGLAIPGTVALANQLLGSCGGNGLGGLFGNRNCQEFETRESANLRQALAAKDSELAREKSERYADSVGIGVYKEAVALSNKNDDRINSLVNKVAEEVAASRVREATSEANIQCLSEKVTELRSTVKTLSEEAANSRVREAQMQGDITCMARLTKERFDAARAETSAAIAALAGTCESRSNSLYQDLIGKINLEAERRSCADNSLQASINLEAERRSCADDKILCYVNGTFVPGKLVMPKDAICPEVMEKYNAFKCPDDCTQTTTGTPSSTGA